MHNVEVLGCGRVTGILIVTPVFNDGACLEFLFRDLGNAGIPCEVDVFVVDDGSTTDISLRSAAIPVAIGSVSVLRVGANVGHQRAIAIGLVEAVRLGNHDAIAVIDSDGEDQPADLVALLEALRSAPDSIVVAQRRSRTDSARFRAFYAMYRVLFRWLTGRRLDFGNFSVLPSAAAQRIVLMPELWNHYPAAIMRSRLAITGVPIDRGHRYSGQSRMSFTALVSHGLAGIASFVDTAFTRLLVLASSLAALFGVLVAGAFILRVSIGVPIPGWAALGASVAAIALVQVLVGLVVVSFLTLSSRSSVSPPPADFASGYVVKIDRIT